MPDYEKIFKGVDPVFRPIDWNAVEGQLGVSVPIDYREYANNYPAANIDDFLNVLHPSCGNPALNLVERSPIIRNMWSALYEQSDGDFPHPIFPAPGGLFPWGYNDENGFYFWKTGGDPSTWTVVAVEGLEWWEYSGGFGDFLSGYTSGEIISPVYKESLSEDGYSVEVFS